jgi:hypothetical protein
MRPFDPGEVRFRSPADFAFQRPFARQCRGLRRVIKTAEFILAIRNAAAVIMVAAFYPFVACAEDMTIDFSWHGTVACRGTGPSPAFRIRNAPANTHSLRFTLSRSGDSREYGGSDVAFPSDGNVSQGAVYSYGPCRPGNYQWTVAALNAAGDVLTMASKTREFPP